MNPISLKQFSYESNYEDIFNVISERLSHKREFKHYFSKAINSNKTKVIMNPKTSTEIGLSYIENDVEIFILINKKEEEQFVKSIIDSIDESINEECSIHLWVLEENYNLKLYRSYQRSYR